MTGEQVAVAYPRGPVEFAGIRNFGWVMPGKLARGEQPPLTDETFGCLRQAGIDSILSLREDAEQARKVGNREVPAYSVEAERRLAEAHGMRFLNVACTDLQAPRPHEVGAAFRVLEQEFAAGRTLFVHCLAGVGRTSVIAGMWMVAQGGDADDAAALHRTFMDEASSRATPQVDVTDEIRLIRRTGRGSAWWALLRLAEALDRPVTPLPEDPEPHESEEAAAWPDEYRRQLAPWRERLQTATAHNRSD